MNSIHRSSTWTSRYLCAVQPCTKAENLFEGKKWPPPSLLDPAPPLLPRLAALRRRFQAELRRVPSDCRTEWNPRSSSWKTARYLGILFRLQLLFRGTVVFDVFMTSLGEWPSQRCGSISPFWSCVQTLHWCFRFSAGVPRTVPSGLEQLVQWYLIAQSPVHNIYWSNYLLEFYLAVYCADSVWNARTNLFSKIRLEYKAIFKALGSWKCNFSSLWEPQV